MADPVVHFEIPADDPKTAQKFYEKMFGWAFEYYKEMEYYGIKAKKDGVGIDGGMMKRKMQGQPFMNYVMVDSVDKYLKKAKDNGGKIALDKQFIGDMGAIGAFIDTEGNLIGLHEIKSKKK